MSFSEQVVSMFPIDVMVSVHGAGLTNILFMLPYSGLVEIFPPLFFEPYYRSICRNSDLIYRSIRYSKIVNKRDYVYIRRKLDLTNKVFYVPPLNFTNDLNDIVHQVREKKYSMVDCSHFCYRINRLVIAHPSHCHRNCFCWITAIPINDHLDTSICKWKRYESDSALILTI